MKQNLYLEIIIHNYRARLVKLRVEYSRFPTLTHTYALSQYKTGILR